MDNSADILALKLAIIKNRNLKFNLLAFSSSSGSNNKNFFENTNFELKTPLQEKEKNKNYPINRKRANSQSN